MLGDGMRGSREGQLFPIGFIQSGIMTSSLCGGDGWFARIAVW